MKMDRSLLFSVVILASISVGLGYFDDESRLVNGQSTSPGDFPFVVSIRLNGNFRCAGFIYNSNHIVTSAICVYGQAPPTLTVTVGQWSLVNADPGEQTFSVASIKIHESFSTSTYRNNIAILTVSGTINFVQPYVDSIRISAETRPGTATIVGWGSTSSGGPLQNELKKKDITLGPESCTIYGTTWDPNTMICAGQGNDVCQGDAGSPLIQLFPATTTTTSTSTSPTTEASTTMSTEMTTSSTSSSSSSSTTQPTTEITTSESMPTENSTSSSPSPWFFEDEFEDDRSDQSGTIIGIVSHNQACTNSAYPTVFTKLVVYQLWLSANAGPPANY